MAEKKTVFEMAKEYYPRLWGEDRIKTLLDAKKLTEEEYDLIINKNEEGQRC